MNKIKFQISALTLQWFWEQKLTWQDLVSSYTYYNSLALITTSLLVCYFYVLVKKNYNKSFYNKIIILNSKNDCYVILYYTIISLKFTVCWVHHKTAFCIKGPRIHEVWQLILMWIFTNLQVDNKYICNLWEIFFQESGKKKT